MSVRLLTCLLASALVASAQQSQPGAPQPEVPEANPGRPTIATPATLTPVGYLQFETGFLDARHSPEFSSQPSVNEVIKFSVSRRVEFLAEDEPFVHSRVGTQTADQAGDVSVGVQGVVYQGEGAKPTVALSYFRRVYNGNTPDLDIGSADNSALFLVSADVKGFHYDTNYFFNEVVDSSIRRTQFGQTLSVSHALAGKFGLTGEIWHFTQPFLRGNAVGNLWAVNYNARSNLVFDAGFNRGLTDTSTRWEVFVGVTYLLPYRIRLH
jgi:hypothetical protein